jgi:hypothetical protein
LEHESCCRTTVFIGGMKTERMNQIDVGRRPVTKATGRAALHPRIQCLSYKTSYTVAMAETITFRPDDDTTKALEVLTKDGTAVSVAVRSALIDAARRKAGAAIRAEAELLAEDESDRAEAMQVLRDMETLRAW